MMTKVWDDQIVIFEPCNVMSHLCQGGVNVTIWLSTVFALIYNIIYGIL